MTCSTSSEQINDTEFKVACRVRVAYLKEQNHHFFTVFLNKFLEHIFNNILKLTKRNDKRFNNRGYSLFFSKVH